MKIISFFTKKKLLYGGAGIAILLALYFGFKDGNGKEFATVQRADVIQEVAATGKVKPNQSVDLGFDKSGRVAGVYAEIGEEVRTGQIIANLEAGETSADLEKAMAFLEEEKIKLRELKSTAPISYSVASKNLSTSIREGFADADNAVRNRTDQFFENVPESPKFEISITSGNFVNYFPVPDAVKIEINTSRKKVESILLNWQSRMNNLNSSNLVSEADAAISDLNFVSSFLDKIAAAVNTFSPAEYAYETTVTGYKTAISAARSEVTGAISGIVAAKDKLNTAPTLGQGGQFESILAQEAKVAQAQANVSSLEAIFDKSTIRAPFDGIITLQEAKTGAAVSPGEKLVSVISGSEMYIEANISEINIGKVAVGNPVTITFDAFPNEKFSGVLSYIEPGDVIVDGVVNYKIRVNLSNPDPKIKSGLTANLKIETAKRDQALAIPLYAVIKEGDRAFVNKVSGESSEKVEVRLGISGNNSLVEILEGLSEGDKLEF